MREDVEQILFIWDRKLASCSLQDIDVMYRELTLEVDSFVTVHHGIDGEADQSQLLVDKLYDLLSRHHTRLTTFL